MAEGSAGNPPSMLYFSDLKLCLIYRYKDEPVGIRCAADNNDGRTWCEELVIRDGVGDYYVGHPRTIEKPGWKSLSFITTTIRLLVKGIVLLEFGNLDH